MSRSTDARIERMLAGAERAGRCLDVTGEVLRQAFRRRVKRGELVSPCPGAFARVAYWGSLSRIDRALHAIRAFARLHPNCVFCGVSAALIHGLWVSHSRLDRMWIAQRHEAHSRGSSQVGRIELRSIERVRRGGVAVTSLRQTVLDCARRLPFAEGLAIADSALRIRGMMRCDLMTSVREMGRGLHGVDRTRRVAARADARSENGGESIARATFIDLGFAVPELQVELTDPIEPHRTMRVDFLWRDRDGQAIAGELDGLQKITDPRFMSRRSPEQILQAERIRESRLTAIVRRVMRISYRDLGDRAYLTRLLDLYGVPREPRRPARDRAAARHGGRGAEGRSRRRARPVAGDASRDQGRSRPFARCVRAQHGGAPAAEVT